ncbi:N-acetylglucosamine-6-phosphate deacetylase [Amylibacter kogurei]|uniref:N-acetylglucosamine-6-phosphate deacetylase n=1 Tax=Paramylibacter kogurei TaxID=1889778 RepID=A0A2G5K7B1_9RHOB|nr:N-acetylglucosamine-6-phosphate deacetylase [Amylibacter kogurei]PIB24740.1 N-acetylglucosamine-6-phosphate deacetylase [Amylibacter kogurei]
MTLTAYTGAKIHDGHRLINDHAFLCDGQNFHDIVALNNLPSGYTEVSLDAGTICPGFVDLQVNGGGGVMFNDDQSVDALQTIINAHASTGTGAILPTLITDTSTRTINAIDAVEAAIDQGIAGIIGIHLEGPHLSVKRKGAHDPDLIRQMTDQDLQIILSAAKRLPNVLITVAPENVSDAQIAQLSAAGVIVSLGHTDATYETCMERFASGATCATHLFNAMSQITGREPGLVGAALDHKNVSMGMIADGIHVHPATIRNAMRANHGTGQMFLVTDAMASVGSDIQSFTLNGRKIFRKNGRLTLADGTLAGADLDMPTALRVMVKQVGADIETAICMATSAPIALLRDHCGYGSFTKGKPMNAVYLDDKLQFQSGIFA